MKHFRNLILGLTALAVLIGCGGGGGSGGSGSGSGAIFITDDLSTGYDHVWVTIKQVSLGKEAGGSSVVFSSVTGMTVDLRSLRDAQGRRFKFISRDDGLSGNYISVTVTMDENVVLFPTGATTGLPRTFEGSSGTQKSLTVSFAPRTFGPGNDDLIVDFDLSTWNENGTQVTGANIKTVSFDNGFGNLDRHDDEDYRGTLGSLQGTAPNQTFNLARGGAFFTVQTNATTQIDASEGGNAILANGQLVEVRGSFDPATNILVAERVKIEDSIGFDDDEAYGAVSNINGGAGTLDLTITSAYFLPAGDPVHVTTNGQTLYRSGSGVFVSQSEFFALIQNGTIIEVEGTYSFATNTLSATKLKIEDGPGDGEDNGEVKGATSQVNAAGHTFKIAATVYFGINVAPGTQITVVTDGSTEFFSFSGGDPLTEAQYFAALSGSPGQLAEVEGFWDGSVLTANKCKLEDSLD